MQAHIADAKISRGNWNAFFINVGPSLSDKIPVQNCSPDQYIKMKAVNSLHLEPVTESQLRGLINHCNTMIWQHKKFYIKIVTFLCIHLI